MSGRKYSWVGRYWAFFAALGGLIGWGATENEAEITVMQLVLGCLRWPHDSIPVGESPVFGLDSLPASPHLLLLWCSYYWLAD